MIQDLLTEDLETTKDRIEASMGAKITARHVVRSVYVLDDIDTDLRDSGPYKLDVVVRMGDFYDAINSLKAETIHFEVATNLFRQRVMLASIRLLHTLRGWIHKAEDIIRDHYDCMETEGPCKCMESNEAPDWLWSLAIAASDNIELHSRASTPWTLSSRQHLVDIKPPVLFTWQPIPHQKVARANADKFAAFAADVVGRILCTWLNIPVDNEWIATAVLLENVTSIIGPGALLMSCTWDAYLSPPRFFTDHISMTQRAFRITAGCFTQLCKGLRDAKAKLEAKGRLQTIASINANYAQFLEKLLSTASKVVLSSRSSFNVTLTCECSRSK